MTKLSGKWKTGQKIMDNLNFFKFKLKEKRTISSTCTLYIFDIDFARQKGKMHIYEEFDRILEKSFLNCGFERDLTISRDRTLLFVAEFLLEETLNKQKVN